MPGPKFPVQYVEEDSKSGKHRKASRQVSEGMGRMKVTHRINSVPDPQPFLHSHVVLLTVAGSYLV